MSLPPENDQNTLCQLDMLVNPLQPHICTLSYCLCIKKGAPRNSEPECRFWAPWNLQEPTVDKNKNSIHRIFSPVRNDNRLNSYIRIITMA